MRPEIQYTSVKASGNTILLITYGLCLGVTFDWLKKFQ